MPDKAGQPCLAQMVQENENKSIQTSLTKDLKVRRQFSGPSWPYLALKLGITLSLLREQGLCPLAPCPEARSSLGRLGDPLPGGKWLHDALPVTVRPSW